MSRFDPQARLREAAFANELAAHGRAFAVSRSPNELFEKSLAWFLPSALVAPRLWDYSRQAHEFAAGLERQGNRLFCSSAETLFWENKAFMHRRFDDVGVAAPRTLLMTRASRFADVDFEPVVVKQEHSAGSAGVQYFERSSDAQRFLESYRYKPAETLVVQELVAGARRDLRLTMVGDRMIEGATYWRTKSSHGRPDGGWTTTATTYGSTVEHANIPPDVVPFAADVLRKLDLRMAGIDVMWRDDDPSNQPLILELSPYFQPNPPKPERYSHLSYKQFKARPFARDGYFAGQYAVSREIAAAIIEQGMF